jgi:hypothetical protein
VVKAHSSLESFALYGARENDNSEVDCLNEEEITMPSLTGLPLKWPLIRQIRERADGSGLEKIGQGNM